MISVCVCVCTCTHTHTHEKDIACVSKLSMEPYYSRSACCIIWFVLHKVVNGLAVMTGLYGMFDTNKIAGLGQFISSVTVNHDIKKKIINLDLKIWLKGGNVSV